MNTFLDMLPMMFIGLMRTVLISSIGIILGILLGIILAALYRYKFPIISQLIRVYINIFRCTPLLVQIFMLYFALPEIGFTLSQFETACLALGLWGGAYQAEIFRSGFESISTNEIIAARALGMSAWQTFMSIELPICFRFSLPSVTTMAITQFRSSSFMVVIGYEELTYMTNFLVSETFRVVEIFAIAAFTYLAISSIISIASRQLEKKLSLFK